MKVKKIICLSILLSNFTAISCPSCIADIGYKKRPTYDCKHCSKTKNNDQYINQELSDICYKNHKNQSSQNKKKPNLILKKHENSNR